jgi:actin-related protein
MECVWQNAYKKIKINSSEHPTLLTEPILNPKTQREKML